MVENNYTIEDNELYTRFVQLGVGCLLRELSLSYNQRVISFVYENYRY